MRYREKWQMNQTDLHVWQWMPDDDAIVRNIGKTRKKCDEREWNSNRCDEVKIITLLRAHTHKRQNSLMFHHSVVAFYVRNFNGKFYRFSHDVMEKIQCKTRQTQNSANAKTWNSVWSLWPLPNFPIGTRFWLYFVWQSNMTTPNIIFIFIHFICSRKFLWFFVARNIFVSLTHSIARSRLSINVIRFCQRKTISRWASNGVDVISVCRIKNDKRFNSIWNRFLFLFFTRDNFVDEERTELVRNDLKCHLDAEINLWLFSSALKTTRAIATSSWNYEHANNLTDKSVATNLITAKFRIKSFENAIHCKWNEMIFPLAKHFCRRNWGTRTSNTHFLIYVLVSLQTWMHFVSFLAANWWLFVGWKTAIMQCSMQCENKTKMTKRNVRNLKKSAANAAATKVTGEKETQNKRKNVNFFTFAIASQSSIVEGVKFLIEAAWCFHSLPSQWALSFVLHLLSTGFLS